MKLDKVSLVSVIRLKRLDMGMTVAELSRIAQIPRSTIIRIESGQVSPRLNTLEKIVDALGLQIEWQLKNSDPHPNANLRC